MKSSKKKLINYTLNTIFPNILGTINCLNFLKKNKEIRLVFFIP